MFRDVFSFVLRRYRGKPRVSLAPFRFRDETALKPFRFRGETLPFFQFSTRILRGLFQFEGFYIMWNDGTTRWTGTDSIRVYLRISGDGEILPGTFSKITYTIQHLGALMLIPVEGHTGVQVPSNSVTTSLQSLELNNGDTISYNFSYLISNASKALFPERGAYAIDFTFYDLNGVSSTWRKIVEVE